jgi:saccharopine dehydrogenase (NAD+, L-lysine-forming)
MMKVMILGYGAIGKVLTKLLDSEDDIEQIICGDVSFEDERKTGRIQQLKINLKDRKQVLDFLNTNKPDIVVNAASPDFNEDILKACIKVKVNYLDMAALWDPNPEPNSKNLYKIEQFDYESSFKENQLVGLIEAGVSPGLTNLFCRESAEDLDEIDHMKIRLLDYSGTDDLTFFWSKEALLDEINCKPLIYENDEFKIMEPFTGEEDFIYPEPFGNQKATLICQDEIGTIPLYIKLKNLDIKDYDNQLDFHRFLYKLGLISRKKIKFENIEISPFEFVCKVLPAITLDHKNKKFDNAQFGFVIQAEGTKGKKKKVVRYSVMFPKQKDIHDLRVNANFISYPTALSAKIFIMAMPKIKEYGVLPPEALSKEVREFIMDELKKISGITVTKEII